jgi:energy-converting hydrogenase Eha subunit A
MVHSETYNVQACHSAVDSGKHVLTAAKPARSSWETVFIFAAHPLKSCPVTTSGMHFSKTRESSNQVRVRVE